MTHSKRDRFAEQNRKHRFPEFGGGRYKVPRKQFRWKKDYNGQRALALIYRYMMVFGTDDEFLNNGPAKLGINPSKVISFLNRVYPPIGIRMARNGTPLTESRVKGRIGNMFRDNRDKTFSFGKEHPKNCPEVLQYLEWADAKLKETL